MDFDVEKGNVMGHNEVVLIGTFVKDLYLLTQISAAATKPFIIRNYSRAVASDVSLSYQYKELSLSLSQSVQWIALFSHIPCKLKGKTYKYLQKRRLPPGQRGF